MSALMFHPFILINGIINNWSSIWYHLMGSFNYPIAVSLDLKVSCLLIYFEGTFVKIWNWCIRKVVLDIMIKERTIYLTWNLHFIIEHMRKTQKCIFIFLLNEFRSNICYWCFCKSKWTWDFYLHLEFLPRDDFKLHFVD